MKILEVTNLFSPVHGGSAEVPYQLSRELSQRGHRLTLYTSDLQIGQEYRRYLPESEVCAFKTFALLNFQVTPGMIARARDEVKRFDVIHLHNYRTFQNILIHHYAKQYGIPYVLQAHGSLPRIMGKETLKRIFDNLWGYNILQDAARLIAVTKVEAEQYQDMGVSEAKIEIVPHGINLAEFENLPQRGEFRSKHGLADNEKIVLYLGRIHRIKGLDLLARAFADIARSTADVRLVVVGPDGGYRPALEKLLTSLGISDRVLLTGTLYGRDKLQAYVDADVYVLPSSYEIFGITILEACACGIPVVVTDRCGIADVIHEQAGLAVPFDKEALSRAIVRLLDDASARLEFGKKGKQLVQETFNWGRIAKKVEGIYAGISNR